MDDIAKGKATEMAMVWTLRKKIFIGYGITLVLMVLVLVWAFINLWEPRPSQRRHLEGKL